MGDPAWKRRQGRWRDDAAGNDRDADGDIAALVYATGDRPDLVLLDFARHVSDSGRRICGLIQFRDRPSDDTRRRVMILDAWTEVDVSHETSAAGGGPCHVDEGWMERMAAQVRASIRDGVDAVIVNRFGPLECADGVVRRLLAGSRTPCHAMPAP